MTETLLKLGCDPSMHGFDYIRCALQILKGAPRTKMFDVYEKVAINYDTTWKSVERCIRHCIQSSITRGDFDLQLTVYANVWSSSKQSLTNGQFLHCLRIYLEAHE